MLARTRQPQTLMLMRDAEAIPESVAVFVRRANDDQNALARNWSNRLGNLLVLWG